MSTMSQRSHLTDSEAWRIVGRIWKRFWRLKVQAEDQDKVVDRQQRPMKNCYLVLTARRHRNMNATLLQQHLRSAAGTTVSTPDCRNRLHGVRLCSPTADGPLTARRDPQTIVVPYAAAIRDDFILMDDNSRPHRANLVEDSLFEEGIVRME
ncbi:transposable element Tcb2 transposase [Trichonephila clavipes]|nr:transposable element Tcb2 transposase [Trichonephila clavipes]